MLRDLHHLPGRCYDFQTDYLGRKVGGLPTDTGTNAWRSDRATNGALHLVVIANQFKPLFGQCADQRTKAHAGLNLDSVLVGIDMDDTVESRHVDDGSGAVGVAVGRCRAGAANSNRHRCIVGGVEAAHQIREVRGRVDLGRGGASDEPASLAKSRGCH